MISTALAVELRAAGVVWAPVSGDAFQIARDDFEGDVFTVSDMTIEAHHYPGGTILGFNGTTEWALDSLALEDAVWLPREDQLRDLLRGAFVSLRREVRESGTQTRYLVEARIRDRVQVFDSDDPAESYGRALLALIRAAD